MKVRLTVHVGGKNSWWIIKDLPMVAVGLRVVTKFYPPDILPQHSNGGLFPDLFLKIKSFLYYEAEDAIIAHCSVSHKDTFRRHIEPSELSHYLSSVGWKQGTPPLAR